MSGESLLPEQEKTSCYQSSQIEGEKEAQREERRDERR